MSSRLPLLALALIVGLPETDRSVPGRELFARLFALQAPALPQESPAALPQESPAAPARPTLQNTGSPMKVQFHCTDDDMLWAGMSCSEEEPCPIYLELSSAQAVGNKLFVCGNLHSSSTTLYSILLASEDGGKTWYEPFERLRAATLDRIQFVDFETGWISGQVLQPLPRDPFFLATGDGGKTWRRRPVFNEERAGFIQQFWFDSRTTGTLLVQDGQRYERHESPNGGETWLVREVSERPIRWTPRASASPTLRVRADAPTRSFQIERREGERWTPVAAFLVSADACKPQLRELGPPPEPPAPPPETAPEAEPDPKAAPRRPGRPPSLKKPSSPGA
ncbi:MAG: hypothetical protein IT158_11400 [Bryobacterales bacterium]|nr:hypothetical protein [Bryobacterales bacterium]